MKLLTMFLGTLSFSSANDGFQIAFINDMHLDPYYESTLTKYKNVEICKILTFGLCNTDLGIYGADVPKKLIQTVIERASPYSDTVLVNGDFVKHGIALDESLGKNNPNWRDAFEVQKILFD